MVAEAEACSTPPPLDRLPGGPKWRVHETCFGPTTPNPVTGARLALRGRYAMLYAAETLTGALWEALLRSVKIKAGRAVKFPAAKLNGMVATPVLPPEGRELLHLSMPDVLRLLHDADGPLMAHMSKALSTARHHQTHGTARVLVTHLSRVGVQTLPALAWRSRQFPASMVYLDYHALDGAERWAVAGDSIALDSPEGHALVRRSLEESGFEWQDES